MTILNESTSAKAVSMAVKGAIKAIGSYRDKVQAAAVLIVEHSNNFGDCSQAKVLARGVPVRDRNSLIGWFRLYSPIGINIDRKDASKDKCGFIRNDKASAFNIDGAKANMWYDDPASVNPEPKPLNTIVNFWEVLDRMLKSQIAKADKDDSPYDPEARELVKAEAQVVMAFVNKERAKSLKNASEEQLKAPVTKPEKAPKKEVEHA